MDDEEGVRFGLRDFLEGRGYEVDEADSCVSAVERAGHARPDLALLDYRLPDGTALDLLPRLHDACGAVPVIVLTAHGSIDLAVRAMKEGAEQFLTKPVELPALLVVIERALENARNRQRQLERSRRDRETPNPFAGASGAMRVLEEQARRVARSDSPVLILGETGSGKGVLARWIHATSARTDETLVDLNCAALGGELLDSELFGHRKGAFTGAQSDKPGLLEVAHRGSVFLDEIGDLALPVQGKLLKVLEEQRFRRIGDVHDRRVDVRLIAATHRDLAGLVREQRFRQDLLFRINTLPLRVPPLRERREDVAGLVRQLGKRLAADLGRGAVTLAPDAERALEAYHWPGNVRELRNVLERALLLSDAPVLRRADLHFDAPAEAPSPPVDAAQSLTLREAERAHIARALERAGGKVEAAAHALGISRSALYEKIKALHLRRS